MISCFTYHSTVSSWTLGTIQAMKRMKNLDLLLSASKVMSMFMNFGHYITPRGEFKQNFLSLRFMSFCHLQIWCKSSPDDIFQIWWWSDKITRKRRTKNKKINWKITVHSICQKLTSWYPWTQHDPKIQRKVKLHFYDIALWSYYCKHLSNFALLMLEYEGIIGEKVICAELKVTCRSRGWHCLEIREPFWPIKGARLGAFHLVPE